MGCVIQTSTETQSSNAILTSANKDAHDNTKPECFDLNIFKEENKMNGLECNAKDYSECQAMNRLFAALKYYSMLNVSENESDRNDIFTAFMCDIYPSQQLIDDYIHFNERHSSEIETINTAIGQCSIDLCAFTHRHHGRNEQKSANFYSETLDSFHFYLFHCFECGMRMKTERAQMSEESKEQCGNKQYFDASFERMNKAISERKHCTNAFQRFEITKNTKFTVGTYAKDKSTYLDGLFRYLLKNTRVSQTDIRRLNAFVTTEEYDSVTLEFDIIESKESNVRQEMENEYLVTEMKKFMQTAKSV